MRMCKKGSAEFKSILYLYIFNFQIYCLFPALHFNCLHAHQNWGVGGLHVSSLFYIVNLKKMFAATWRLRACIILVPLKSYINTMSNSSTNIFFIEHAEKSAFVSMIAMVLYS